MGIRIGTGDFYQNVETGLDDRFMREAISGAQDRLRTARLKAAEKLGDWEEWRALGEEIRRHTLENLDFYLKQLSDQVAERGGYVYFAHTADDAKRYIQKVAEKKKAQKVVKSKSMMTEEIGLNEALEALGCEVIETDLGEYILQVDDHDPPSHIVAPSVHKDKTRVQKVFQEKKGYKGTENPEEITRFTRKLLRKEFLTADLGITGCNFAVAESGTVTLVTNEGNARLVTTLPKTHIAVMGMERIVPTWEELDVLVSLLVRSAVGQTLTSYVTAISGPKRHGESDGAEEFHLVIVDNGRTNILGTPFQDALHCIRCGACLNVCPVYSHIGGHAYGSIYPGPIGAVLTPLLDGYERHHQLPFASSLCAACTEACPVRIPLHELLVRHRQEIVEKEKRAPRAERLGMKTFGAAVKWPAVFDHVSKAASRAARPFVREEMIESGPGPLKNWTMLRDFPAPKKTRFRDWYFSRERGKNDDRKNPKSDGISS